MSPIYSIIAEDITEHLHDLKELLSEFPFIEIVAETNNIEEAEKEILFHKPDLVFLDIRLGGVDVFPMLEQLAKRKLDFGIVFITSYYKDYLEKAVETCSFTNRFFYLAKPVSEKKLKNCIDQFKDIFETKSKDRLIIKSQTGFYQVTYDEIVYLETYGNYCNAVLSDGKRIPISINLSDMERSLPKERFYRLSSTYLIHRDRVRESKILNSNPRKYICLIEEGSVKVELNIPEKRWRTFKKQFPSSL